MLNLVTPMPVLGRPIHHDPVAVGQGEVDHGTARQLGHALAQEREADHGVLLDGLGALGDIAPEGVHLVARHDRVLDLGRGQREVGFGVV